MTVEREYEMDEAKVLAEFGPPEKHGQTKEEFLRESFYELCGFERDQDHIDGSYVWQTGMEYADLEMTA